MAGGRPTDYKPEYCEQVIAHMSEGASLTSFAASIDCSRSTVGLWMEVHEEFSAAVKIGKAKCAYWWEKRGRMGANGEQDVNPTLVIFGLKNMAPDEWREKQELQHSGSIDITKLPDDELARRIAELSK
jgi:transposase